MRRLAARPRVRTLVRAAGVLLAMSLLGGCLLPPTPETTQAKDVFTLYVVVFIMAAVVFFGVEGSIVYSIFRYRRRDDRLPDQLHGHTLVEIIWTAIPTVIVVFLFVWSTSTLGTMQANVRPGRHGRGRPASSGSGRSTTSTATTTPRTTTASPARRPARRSWACRSVSRSA